MINVEILKKELLKHKADVIRKSIELNKPNPKDAVDVLSKVGGFEIGAMAGVILGCAANRVPVVLDGFISYAAALIAYNINLDTTNIEIASKIAKTIRHSSGGYRYIKAGPVEVPERKITQVTMNLTDYTKTSMYRAFEAVKMEAKRYGVNIIGSEIVGLCPMEALVDVASYYLGLENFTLDKVLETSLME